MKISALFFSTRKDRLSMGIKDWVYNCDSLLSVYVPEVIFSVVREMHYVCSVNDKIVSICLLTDSR